MAAGTSAAICRSVAPATAAPTMIARRVVGSLAVRSLRTEIEAITNTAAAMPSAISARAAKLCGPEPARTERVTAKVVPSDRIAGHQLGSAKNARKPAITKRQATARNA
ncbi:hypothetical protein D9M72_608560 [compost metagenome]